jgi:ABC-type transport system substrate-binding protein
MTARILAWTLVFALLLGNARPAVANTDRPTLRVAVAVTPNTLNPLTRTQTTESFIASLMFDGIVRATPDGKIAAVLAAALPTRANGGISADGRTITYKLRRGVRWHDGAPFTSRDVVFTQHAAVNPRNNITARDPYRSVAAIDAPDDFTVVVRNGSPVPAAGYFRPICLRSCPTSIRYRSTRRRSGPARSSSTTGTAAARSCCARTTRTSWTNRRSRASSCN